ncbi:hypothetical protein BS17DRAFT_717932, partial [Gyrodon lividus]
DFRTMVWPTQSPDLDPIEHALAEHEQPPKGIGELWERVQVEWERISAVECLKLIESMLRKVEAVIKAKGG